MSAGKPHLVDHGCAVPFHERSTAPGGLAVVGVQQPHLHRASVAVFLRLGSRYEALAANGLSHFLEHMLFRGTERHPTAYGLNRAVEELGGTLYAATAPDSTEVEISLPPDNLEQGIRLLAEVVTQPVFSDLEIERRIIAEEIREDLDEDGHPIDIDFLTRMRLWPGDPLGQSVIGPLSNVLAFDESDLRRHFAAHYIAPNAVVCVSGRFDRETVAGVVAESFAPLAAGGAATRLEPAVQGLGPTVGHAKRAGSQTQIRIAFHAPGDDDPDRVPLALLLNLLDDGMSTRLHRRVFDELGLAYQVAADIDGYADVSAFHIDATTSHEKVADIAREVLALVTGLCDAPLDGAELDKAKRRAIWRIEELLDDPHAMSGWYGEQELYRPAPALEQRAAQIAALEAVDIGRVARRVFKRENIHLTTVGVLPAGAAATIERIVNRFQ